MKKSLILFAGILWCGLNTWAWAGCEQSPTTSVFYCYPNAFVHCPTTGPSIFCNGKIYLCISNCKLSNSNGTASFYTLAHGNGSICKCNKPHPSI